MTNEPLLWLIAAVAGLAGLIVATRGALAGWRGWLDLRRAELDARGPTAMGPGAGTRIEMADLKERIRKLEAIAAGVDL